MSTRKKIIILLSAISLVALIFIIVVINKDKTSKKVVPSTEAPAYKNLQPGKSSGSDIINSLGQPVESSTSGATTTFEYPSSNPNFNDQYKIKEDSLELIKQIVSSKDDIKISDINNAYGDYENVLYKSSSHSGFNLYIYPSKGVAYYGHQGSGIVLEIWYFQPTTFDEFKASFSEGYSENPVEGQ